MNTDFILSLGPACRPAWHLKLNQLRYVSCPFDWMMNYQYDNSKRANSVLIIILTALIVSVFACTVRPVFGILGCVLSALCLGRVVFSKFWNKYLSHVPEMALLTVVWFLIILALL